MPVKKDAFKIVFILFVTSHSESKIQRAPSAPQDPQPNLQGAVIFLHTSLGQQSGLCQQH